MSLREFYRDLSTLTPAQRALYAARLAESGEAGEAKTAWETGEILPRPLPEEPVPAALVQRRIWFLTQLEPDNPFYNLPLLCFHLRGAPRTAALERALREIERRHEALRTAFVDVDGTPVQQVAPPARRPLPAVDLGALPAAERRPRALALAREESRRPFDLARAPLWRYLLLRLDAGEHLLLIAMHHIVSDAWSLGVLYRELAALYAAFAAGLPSPLPELPFQYPDFARWEARRLQGEALAELVSFWRGYLAGAPERTVLPADRPRPAVRTFAGRRRSLAPPPELAADLDALAHGAGCSLFMVLLAAYGTLLHRYTAQRDLVVGFPVAGRPVAELETLIGFFVNTVAVRLRPSPEQTFRELVARVRDTVLEVYEHQELPFDRVVEELKPRRDRGHSPIFQLMLSLQNTSSPDLALAGLAVTPERVDNGTCQTDLILFAGMRARRLGVLQIEHNTDLFDPATIQRLGGHLLALMSAAARRPAETLADLPLLHPAERHQLVVERHAALFPAGDDPVAPERCLHRLFAAQVVACPEAPAVIDRGERWSYAELGRRARRLARRLRSHGVGPEVPVGLCAGRSAALVAGVLGILEAGGAYLPIDPETPPERIRFLLADAGAPLLLTTRELAGALPPLGVPVLGLDEAAEPAPAETAEPATDGNLAGSGTSGTLPDNLAYVIYTSGSTGEPKGALVTHRNVVRLFAAARRELPFDAGDVWTLFHSHAFDFSVWELWGALLHGGSLVVVPRETTRDPALFAELLRAERVTVLSQTPSALRQLLAALEPGGLPHLRLAVCGGEALAGDDVRAWYRRRPGPAARLVNMYGITETTVHVTCREIAPADGPGAGGGAPIGGPLADLALHLLEPGGWSPAPLGAPGELCVGGAGLCRGYLGRPELTAERFVPDPFAGRPGARLYRSGDLGRLRPDLDLEYLGRADQQVKVRGVRIEPGEIEAALRRHPGVHAAAVAPRPLGGELRLVAWIVPAAAPAPGHAELRAFLGGLLPEAMLPAHFVPVPRLPLTPNGKLDRRALPDPAPDRPELQSTFQLPRPGLEETVAGLFRELLGRERVGAHDDFFELGGHSLLATRAVARLRDRLGLEVTARMVFEAPTAAGLARAIEGAAAGGRSRSEPALVPGERRARRLARS